MSDSLLELDVTPDDSMLALLRELAEEEGERVLTCAECKRPFVTNRDFHRPLHESRPLCLECGSARRHWGNPTAKREGPPVCDWCKRPLKRTHSAQKYHEGCRAAAFSARRKRAREKRGGA